MCSSDLTPMYPVGRPISLTTPLSADWTSLQCTLSAAPSAPPPQCRLTGHHPNIPHRQPHQPHHPTVGQLVITPMYPVGHPINPITPLSADWSSPRPHRQLTGHHPNHTVGQLVITHIYPISCPISPTTPLLANWSSPTHTPLATPSAQPPHCRPTGDHSNIPCQPPHQPHHPTIGQLVFT